ncbi:PEGA domain-containing protein, partial [Myxococcota bacterium]|nr:PEGA domain-containing protein [Myxococcota bacterium]
GPPKLAPPRAAAFAVSEVDESEIQVRSPRRYLTGLLFLLLVVTILFGIQYLFVEDGERMNSRRTPTRAAAALPPATTMLGSAAPGAPEAPATAPARLGIVRVESDPPGARVVVNGNMLNSLTPASVQTFADQKSTVRVLEAGYLPWESRVDVGATGTDVRATLKKGRPELGKLLVETSPAGARVLINGAEVGSTPLTLEKVGAGVEMTMRLEKDGHHPHGVLFTLEKDEERAIGVNLMPDTGPRAMAVVNVESIPLGATIFDAMGSEPGRALGKTGNFPLKVSRPVDGGLRLRAELAGFGTAERDLDLKLAYYTVYLRLTPPEKHYGTLTLGGAPKVMVYLGAQELGETPLRKVRIPSGEQVLVMVDGTSGRRAEATVKVEKNGALERKVVVVDGVPGLQ